MSSGLTAEMPALSAAALDEYDPFCAGCGTELEDDQEWCLECGASRTLIHRAPTWRVPVAIVAIVVVLVLAGIAIALVNLSEQTNTATRTVTVAAPAPAAATGAAPAAAPAAAGAAAASPHIGSWPVGLSGWTVVLFTSHREATARATAARLATHGLGVGVLNSDQHPHLAPGNWVVFAGRYPHGPEATAAAARLRASGHPAAHARQVARPGGL
jgi:hypothetical protein